MLLFYSWKVGSTSLPLRGLGGSGRVGGGPVAASRGGSDSSPVLASVGGGIPASSGGGANGIPVTSSSVEAGLLDNGGLLLGSSLLLLDLLLGLSLRVAVWGVKWSA